MKTPSGKEDVMALGVRLLHSVCYLPNMGIAASFITNQPFEPMEIHQRRQQSRQQAADLAKSVLQLPLAGRMRRQYVAGLAAEVAGGLLGQIDDVGDNPLRYIVMPSPFRHDNHPEAHLRGDLVANATFAPFRKTLMQITSF